MGKRKLWHETPWDGKPGIWAAWLRLVYQFEGTSQLGKRGEPAYVMPADPKCPICGTSMKDHQILRSTTGKSTRLECPPQPEAEHDSAPEHEGAEQTPN